jgi:Sigma-70 region 3
MQVGYVGLLKAINNFDPALGGSLAADAQPTITGELKRHFRDKRWPVHVGRSVQELVLEVRAATEDLTPQLGRPPADADLAAHLGVSTADLHQARLAEMTLRPFSLDEPLGGHSDAASLADLLGEDDRRIDHMLAMNAVAAHWEELPARERTVLMLRFHGGLSQAEKSGNANGEGQACAAAPPQRRQSGRHEPECQGDGDRARPRSKGQRGQRAASSARREASRGVLLWLRSAGEQTGRA